jgi:phosphoribosylformimino-5-aminoimidazole carboxamide ribotide isomerase
VEFQLKFIAIVGCVTLRAMEIIPSIDLRNGRVVRLKQGDYAQQINFDVDPIATAQSFAAAGAKWMHIVDLDGAKEGRLMQTDLIVKVIASARIHVQAAGGIRSVEDIDRLLDAGAKRVIVGTRAMEDWSWFESLVLRENRFADKIVLALDAKDGVVATRGWTAGSGKLAVDVARQVSDWPLAAILYTDVAKDGMMTGPNYPQTRKLAEAGKVPVIASGGVGNISHIREVKKLPVWGVIVGRSLYEGTLDLREAIRIAR